MERFSSSVSAIGTELHTIATRFSQADQSQEHGVQTSTSQSASGKDVRKRRYRIYMIKEVSLGI